jgi:hypothetical protein
MMETVSGSCWGRVTTCNSSRDAPRIGSSRSKVPGKAITRKPGRTSHLTHTLAQSSPRLILNYDVPGELLLIPRWLNSKAGAAGFLRS